MKQLIDIAIKKLSHSLDNLLKTKALMLWKSVDATIKEQQCFLKIHQKKFENKQLKPMFSKWNTKTQIRRYEK
jgi:hypothetical protein